MNPAYRGAGRTDSLLDYVEQSAREAGVRRLLFLSGTHIAASVDWFVLHSFEVGPALSLTGLALPMALAVAPVPTHLQC